MQDVYTSDNEDSSDDDEDDYRLNIPDFLEYEVFSELKETV